MSHEWAKATVASAVLVLLFLTGLAITEWRTEVVPVESMDTLTEALFETYVLPFEVLSILLLGALIAALYVGAKVPREPGGGTP